jgi:phage tail-like protein
MDVNGSRFALVLGKDDWLRCHRQRVDYDEQRDELTLRPDVFRFPSSPQTRPPQRSDRRGAGADVFGNWYWIGADARTILVTSVGDGSTGQFWPGPDAAPSDARLGTFGDLTPAPAIAPQLLSGAAVTDDHYLAVGTRDPDGLLIFDLQGGGAPLHLPWPGLHAFDIVRRPGGGVFVLDADARLAWELDRRFKVVPTTAPATAAPPTFAPLGGAPPAAPAPLDQAQATALAGDPIAIEPAPGGGMLVLDANPGHPHSLVALYREGALVGTAPTKSDDPDVTTSGHDMALVGATLFVADSAGDQSYAFTLSTDANGLRLTLVPRYHPMRLFGGKGIVATSTGAWYDCEDRWVPLADQSRARHAEHGVIVTRAFDAGEPGCVWHRLMLDARLPLGASLRVWSAAGDEPDALDALAPSSWCPEPTPQRRRGGPEVPFAVIGEYDTFELLFQRARGRFLKLRIELVGDGRATPRLRALRAWYPRFSYLERYLPAAYREDEASASFLDRYLANVEGMATAIEDRIAAAQLLLGARTAPAEVLEWLAEWVGLALDPLWDERRRRLMLEHAMQFFAARGTMRGIEIALRFVLDTCVDERVFDETRPPALATARIVETYRTRRTPGVVFGDPTALPLPPAGGEPRWTPAAGAGALQARYDAFTQTTAPYPIADGDDDWRAFSLRALGFVPVVPDPARWRAFLAHRYASAAAVHAAYVSPGAAPADFSELDPPTVLPSDGPALVDWFAFQSVVLPMERRAHRFSVLLPWPLTVLDSAAEPGTAEVLDHTELRELARRVVELQKPAHTVFDVKFFWAAFRIGEARLGDDTLLASGSRVPELVRAAVLGTNYLGTSYLGGAVASDVVARTPPPYPDPPAEEAP